MNAWLTRLASPVAFAAVAWLAGCPGPTGPTVVRAHRFHVMGIVLQPNDASFLTWGIDRRLCRWSWPAVRMLASREFPSSILAVAPCSDRGVVVALGDGRLVVLDTDRLSLSASRRSPMTKLNGVAVHRAGGPVVAVGSEVLICDGDLLAKPRWRRIAKWSAIGAVLSPDSSLVAVGGLDKVVLYSVATGRVVRSWQGHWIRGSGGNKLSDWVDPVRFTPDGRTLIAAGDREICWVSSPWPQKMLRLDQLYVTSLDVRRAKPELCIGHGQEAWVQPIGGASRRVVSNEVAHVTAIAWASDGKSVIIGRESGELQIVRP